MSFHYALKLAYDGRGFEGWQSQPSGLGIQDELARAFCELGDRNVKITGAGRTDTGVHAREQIAGVVLEKDWQPRRLVLALNAKLDSRVSVMSAAPVDPGFDARKSALSREYRYFIWNSSVCYPYLKPYVLWLPGRYDWKPAAQASRLFEGTHDFKAYCKMRELRENTVRTVHKARLYRRGHFLLFRVVANSYLTNMIRIMVGNLVELASGRRDIHWFEGLLSGSQGRDRSAKTATAAGLFFWHVTYPQKIDWC